MSDASPPTEYDPDAKERRNITVLLRWISAFVAWPSLSLGLVFLLEWQDHILHIAGLIPLGVAGLVLFWQAPAVAGRFYPPPA